MTETAAAHIPSTSADSSWAADLEEARRQNAEERIRNSGVGHELFRRSIVEKLRPHMEAQYEHGAVADLMVLLEACRRAETNMEETAAAPLLEAFLVALGLATATPATKGQTP